MRISIILSLICFSAFADDSIKTFNGHENGVKSIAISNSGQLAISASKDETVRVWDINSGTEIRTCYGHDNEVTSISFSPDDSQAISGDLDGNIILWNINTCQALHKFTTPGTEVKSVAWSPNNVYILSGHNNNIVKLWDIATKQEIRTFTGHTDQVSDVSFSPNSTLALSASKDKTIKLWHVATGTEIHTFTGHTKWVVSAAFSADGLFVISSSWDNTIRRWNIQAGEHIIHSDQTKILDVNFLINSNYVLSGGEDQTLKVWNLNTTKSLCTLTGHTDTITSVAVSKDGKILLSASSDKTLKQWQVCKIPPKAEFSYSIRSMTVTLNASQSKAINDNIVKYEWSTSDGQTSSGVRTSFRFKMSGNYIINLTVTDNHGISAQQLKNVTVPLTRSDSLIQAIIIAGGGAQSSNTLFPYTNEYVQRMYNFLTLHGTADSDIYYMNPRAPDFDGDGYQEYNLQDYTLRNAKADIKHAFAQATKKSIYIFLLYIHGHARKDHIKITPTYELSASELKSLLDELPEEIVQVIILDTCYSGSFMDELAGVKNRIVITSTDDKSLAWQVTYNSFSNKLLTQLYRGATLGDAFKDAEQFIQNDQKFFGQTPWLDDNGDGYYSDNDGRLADLVYLYPICPICYGPLTHDFELQIHPRIVLKDQQTSTTIWIKTKLSHDNIRKVRAILVRPNLVNTEYKGMETDFGREEIELIYNAAQDRYEIVYDRFWTKGTWNILYQAQDNDGFWSEIETGEIEQTSDNLTDIKIDIALNKSSYKVSDEINWNVSVNAQNKILFLGIILDNGSVKAVNTNGEFNQQIQPYQQIKLAGQQSIFIKTPIPENSPLGNYLACGVLIPTGETFQMDGSNWLALDCTGFKVQ